MEVTETRENMEPDEADEEEDDDEAEDDEEEDEEDEQEAEEELEDVEGLLLARFLDRLAGGFAACTSSAPAAVNRNSLPARSS
jgi:TATA-binding protein-associated factor Taf7